MFGRMGGIVGRALGSGAPAPSASGGGAPLMPIPRTKGQWNSVLGGLFGAPGQSSDSTHDRAASDVYNGPYRGPLDLDRYGGETAEARRRYRELHSSSPVFRGAMNGQRDDIAVLEPSITSGNKKNPEANAAAEFVKWTVATAPGGWPGLLGNMYLPGSLDGYSVLEKKRRPQVWEGRGLWGLAHVRSLDTVHIRLQLDVYRNVIGVVNMVRGLEYYKPDGYLLYTHNGLYNNPFGQSDGRAAIEAAQDIADVYKLWYIALKVYGLPYMKGKTTPQNRKLMEDALKGLRGGGYAVLTGEKDDIELLNMAVGAALNGFESYIHTRREDIFFAVRNVAQPFMEGDGGQNAHTDTETQQGASNAGEKFKAHNLVEVIKHQLIPWLVEPNFQLEEWEYPQAKLGGTDWKQNKNIIDTIKAAQEAGFDLKKSWAVAQIAAEAADPNDPSDRLVSPQEKQQQQQAQQQAAQQPQLAGGPQLAPAAPPQPTAPDRAPASTFSDSVSWVPTSRLDADPERFQFRRGHDADDGTVRPLPEAKFDATKCPPLAAWKDPKDAREWVVDGHHRLAWAERDGAKRVPVKWITAKTDEDAKKIGERMNADRAPASTFSADHLPRPDGVSAEQMARVMDELLKELMA